MKLIFLASCVFFILLTAASAQEILRCTDADGNVVLTSSPQDGMKCVRGESNDEPKKRKMSSSRSNLMDTCSHLSHELEDVSAEITDLEKQRTELQRKELDRKKNETQDYSRSNRRFGRPTPANDEMNKLNKELSTLYQKKSLVSQDLRLYKCSEMNRDLTILNDKAPETNRGRRYR